ncbi:glycyl-tRNA synthetase / glycine--tRNA ligase [Striga asiatica]|uniref:glycine--tRNA ligase n=1 Tax=Striga asiatica TaxID=4170 RepID=A0A5A7QT60_STRAF|nr:glycyl-tRNA synthetase / glycine--tRNA ligase [Striga asiatica]
MNVAQEAQNREAFRHAVVNTLERRLFYIPSFKIYRGVAGLYDYGPPGCAVKSNVLAFWRQHFVLEENMLEVDCPCVTPEVVLKASGHVDKFTDLMVKDEKTGTCYRADHLLKDHCKEKLEKDPNLSADKATELRHVLAVLDDLSSEELGAKIKSYGITAPDTKNSLSDPYPFNLMFQTSIGPSGLSSGYMRPETAQGIFVNFKDLYYYNGNKLPFAAAQIGQAFRNEVSYSTMMLALLLAFFEYLPSVAWDLEKISPRQGLLRVREFTLAEIEHFVDPEDKSHPKFAEVAQLEFLMFPREDQVSGRAARRMAIGEAVEQGIVNNETLGYFIGRAYLFLTQLGIDKDRLRFRQHLANEMAHYAADCWDAEIECSYGWIECVGIADRSAYDLRAHTDKSGVPLVAHEKFTEPREVEKLVIAPVKKELGLAFKGSQKMVVEALEAMDEKEAMELKATLEAKGEASFRVCTLEKTVNIKSNMVSISKKKKKEHQRVFTPSVIEPSFGIGRIIYCLYEHSFYTRPSRDGDEQLNVFGFPPLVAPIKCTVFPLVQNEQFEEVARRIARSLTAVGITYKIDITGTSIGKRYARTDELGVPLAITVDSESSVTVRERDSKQQIRVSVDEVASVVKEFTDGVSTWGDVLWRYPTHSNCDDVSWIVQKLCYESDRRYEAQYRIPQGLLSLLKFLSDKVIPDINSPARHLPPALGPPTVVKSMVVLKRELFYLRSSFRRSQTAVFCTKPERTFASSQALSVTDDQTLFSILESCKLSHNFRTANTVHSRIIKHGYGMYPLLLSTLLKVYMACQKPILAQQLLAEVCCPNFGISANLLIDSCLKTGEIDMAEKVFSALPIRDVVTWNLIIGGNVKSGFFVEAIELFKQMLETNIEPDGFTFASVINACSRLGALSHGKWVHSLMIEKKIELNYILSSALIDMYSRCGRIETAKSIFSNAQKTDVSIWNAIINGLAIHGLAVDAISVFSAMEREKDISPDSVTFMGIIKACSHCGLLEQGQWYFNLMQKSYLIRPEIEHYGAMVDLFARAGLLEEAYAMINEMPMEPDVFVWRTLLSACRTHKKSKLGEEVVGKIKHLGSGDYVLMSNMYCSTKKWDYAENMRQTMNKKGVHKAKGKSWVELHGMIHHFRAGDRSHPETESIYTLLEALTRRSRMEGYVSVQDLVLMDISEEEKEENLNYHSEKLAVACGILKSSPGTEILISKNLRTCLDCHSWIKIVSKVLHRVINMRDRIRFHRFEKGSCSCGDYW